MKKAICVGVVAMMGAIVIGCSSGDSSSPSSTPSGQEPTGSAQGSLYERLGGHDGIAKAVDGIVAEELKDPEIASYFFFQVQQPLPAGHPSADQIKECLVAQLGNAAGGPETYPMTATGGFKCRSMTAAHAKLSIPNGVFTKFLTIAAGVLKSAGVMDKDIETVGGVLEGTRDQVAQDHTRENGSFSAPKN
jgi:truncated hemoglobin YjbI